METRINKKKSIEMLAVLGIFSEKRVVDNSCYLRIPIYAVVPKIKFKGRVKYTLPSCLSPSPYSSV